MSSQEKIETTKGIIDAVMRPVIIILLFMYAWYLTDAYINNKTLGEQQLFIALVTAVAIAGIGLILNWAFGTSAQNARQQEKQEGASAALVQRLAEQVSQQTTLALPAPIVFTDTPNGPGQVSPSNSTPASNTQPAGLGTDAGAIGSADTDFDGPDAIPATVGAAVREPAG